MTALRLVSAEHGRIDAVLFAMPAAFFREEPGVLDALAGAVDGGIEAVVLAHAGIAEAVRARLPAGSATVVPVPDEAPLSVWIQDQTLAFSAGEGPPALLLGPRFTAGGLPHRAVGDRVLLDGGNLLVGTDYTLIGRDELAFWRARRAVSPPPDEAEALALLAADYGLTGRVVPVGAAPPAESPYGRTEWRGADPWRIDPDPGIVAKGSTQAAFHIDVYITPAGRDASGRPRLLVGDPRSASALAGLDPPPEAYAARFDAEASALAEAGFAVLRSPLATLGIDHPHRRRRTRHILSANNTWVEATGVSAPRAIVPTFAAGPDDPLRAVDEAMTGLWRAIGFTVTPLAGLRPLALRNGGLNCASRILRRSLPRADGRAEGRADGHGDGRGGPPEGSA